MAVRVHCGEPLHLLVCADPVRPHGVLLPLPPHRPGGQQQEQMEPLLLTCTYAFFRAGHIAL